MLKRVENNLGFYYFIVNRKGCIKDFCEPGKVCFRPLFPAGRYEAFNTPDFYGLSR